MAPRPFLLLTPPFQRVGWVCTRNWEGTQPGQLPSTDPREIPYHMASCSLYISWGRRRKGGIFKVIAFVFLVATTCNRALLSWRWLNISLPMGSGEGIPCFALLMCAAFDLPIKLSLSQPTSLLTDILILSPPYCREGSKQLCSCPLGLNHNI